MNNKRTETRLLCAELVEVMWRDKSGTQRRRIANLEDISLSGACIQMEHSLMRDTPVVIRYGDGEMKGFVKYCLYRDFGYFIGLQFDDCKWSSRHFKPKHLLDPRKLVHQSARRMRTLGIDG